MNPSPSVHIELRHLRYFLAIAQARSFTRAAEALQISQPTLSHQIRQLEDFAGAVLFDRAGRDIALTAAGQLLRPYCERLVFELTSGLLAVSELGGLMRGNLQIAVFHSFSTSLLAPVVAEFALRYPGVHVIARLLSRSDMERELLDGALDFAVAYRSEDTKHIVAERIFDERLVLVVGPKHPLATARRLAMRELVHLDLALLTSEFGARQLFDRFFAKSTARPRIVLEMNAVDPILSIVENSSLASVLSEGAIGDRKGVHVVILTHPTPKRVAAILWRRHGQRSAAARCMATMIHSAYEVSQHSKTVSEHSKTKASGNAPNNAPTLLR